MSPETWEGVAAAIHEGTGLDDPPVSAFELARMCGLRLRPWGSGTGALMGEEIYYPRKARLVRQHGVVAHELGHWALGWAGEKDSEEGARWLAGALLLPRRVLDQDLRRSWDLEALRARHVHASAEMVARRIVALRDAVATVIDQGKVRVRVTSPWLPDPRLRRITRWERELADQALGTHETVYGDSNCYAVPVIDPPFHRVIVVCESRQLSLRLSPSKPPG